jgi:acyl-CoA reductase-like NAD-dependent aldehyde dehydrogenase
MPHAGTGPRGAASRAGEQGTKPDRGQIFGPVAPVVTFDTLDDAARLAVGTEYGLSLGTHP